MSILRYSSPAKVNLLLNVLSKRSDGFHTISTIFERINLCDELTFYKTQKKISITCNHPQVPTGSKNLVYKVASLLHKNCNIQSGVHINIKKSIPVASGLAGGSTNAATSLIALNQLWHLNLNHSQLNTYASHIGSDVSFFLHNSSFAIGEDRGQVITPLKLKKTLWHILIVPKIKLYAKDVYESLCTNNLSNEKVLTRKKDNANIFFRSLQRKGFSCILPLMKNDLETSVMNLCPKIKVLKERLTSLGAKSVMVSGSGPSVFGLTQSKKEAYNIKQNLDKRYSQVYVVKTF